MLLSKLEIPRIPTTTIRRDRLERWLRMHDQTPVRLLVAPAGSGKTSLLLKYAADLATNVAYCALATGAPPEELYAGVGRALGDERIPGTYDDMLSIIRETASDSRLELIIDDAGDGAEETIARLHQLVEDVPDTVALIYVARSNDRIGASRLISRGLAETCDARRLNFDVEDARLLAERCDAESNGQALQRLISQTDGWALALCASIRTAGIENEDLTTAYRRWRSEAEQFLRDFTSSELERIPPDDAALFRRLLTGNAHADAADLRRLRAYGLHIVEDGDTLRPYHPFCHKIRSASPAKSRMQTYPLLSIKMLGEFQARFGERDIPWVRRRDQQIIKYLAMKPDGKATRTELRNAFWSGTDHHLATQSMRTAFSTIRRAIAAVVGYDQVEWYFRTTPDVQLVLNHVVCDVRRFVSHVTDAEASFQRNEMQEAAFHYRAAEKLYGGDLLEFEPPEPSFAPHAIALRERYLLALERLGDIALETGNREEARQYALRAAKAAPNHTSVTTLLQRTIQSATIEQATPVITATSERSIVAGSAQNAR